MERALQEREKEFECLYKIGCLAERHEKDLEGLLQGIVDLLPLAWRYPEICSARLTLHDQVFVGVNFLESPWTMSASLLVRGESVGRVEVFYRKRPNRAGQSLFLEQEHRLLRLVAGRAGVMIDRFWTERELRTERAALEAANVALREVLGRIEAEKRSIQVCLVENVQRVLLPVIETLEREISAQQRCYTGLLRKHLEEITSPFTHALSTSPGTLTPSELQVCELLRNGCSTKEIARFRGVAMATVRKQRERIRRKLSLQGSSKNLAAYLATLFPSGV